MHASERLVANETIQTFDAERELAQCERALGRQSARAQSFEMLGKCVLRSVDDAQEESVSKGAKCVRVKLRGLKRNAAVVLGTAGTADDDLIRALDDSEPLVREHAAWAVEAVHTRGQAPEPPSASTGRGAASGPAATARSPCGISPRRYRCTRGSPRGR